MRSAITEKEDLIRRLEKLFGRNEPIFIKEIISSWNEYSRSRVLQLIRELCTDGALIKDIPGVYYLPKETVWGGVFSLDTMKIIEKRYLKDGGKVFGYYSGHTLMNDVGLSNQVPNTDEIVTVNEATRVRTVVIDGFKVILRRAKIKINEKNAPVMQLLEIFNRYDGPLAGYQRENLIALAGGTIDKNIVMRCAKCFPKRALENFKRSGMYDVLPQ